SRSSARQARTSLLSSALLSCAVLGRRISWLSDELATGSSSGCAAAAISSRYSHAARATNSYQAPAREPVTRRRRNPLPNILPPRITTPTSHNTAYLEHAFEYSNTTTRTPVRAAASGELHHRD